MGGSGRNPIAFRDGLDSRDGVFAKKKKLPSEDAVASFTAVVRNTAEFGTIIGMSVSDAWAKLQAFTRPRVPKRTSHRPNYQRSVLRPDLEEKYMGPQKFFQRPQVIPDVDEELDNIAGELVHDLGATNSVAATLSSTIVGKKGNASLSHAHLRQMGNRFQEQKAMRSNVEAEGDTKSVAGDVLPSWSDGDAPGRRRHQSSPGVAAESSRGRMKKRGGMTTSPSAAALAESGADAPMSEDEARMAKNRDRIARQTVMRALNATLLAHRLRQVAGDEAPAFDKVHCQNIYWYLWAPNAKTGMNFNLARLPSTLVIRQGLPAAWFFSDKNGEIKKRHAERFATRGEILELFRPRRRRVGQQESPIVAHFVPRDFKGVGFDMIQMDWTNLELFCLQGELRDGILQAHVRSSDDSTYLVEVEWTTTMFRVRRARVRGLPRAVTRMGCKIGAFEPAIQEMAERTADTEMLTGMTRRLREVCSELVKHIHEVSPQRYWVQSMVLHFAMDSAGEPWLLYCSELRAEMPLETETNARERRDLVLSKPPGVFVMPEHLSNPYAIRRPDHKTLGQAALAAHAVASMQREARNHDNTDGSGAGAALQGSLPSSTRRASRISKASANMDLTWPQRQRQGDLARPINPRPSRKPSSASLRRLSAGFSARLLQAESAAGRDAQGSAHLDRMLGPLADGNSDVPDPWEAGRVDVEGTQDAAGANSAAAMGGEGPAGAERGRGDGGDATTAAASPGGAAASPGAGGTGRASRGSGSVRSRPASGRSRPQSASRSPRGARGATERSSGSERASCVAGGGEGLSTLSPFDEGIDGEPSVMLGKGLEGAGAGEGPDTVTENPGAPGTGEAGSEEREGGETSVADEGGVAEQADVGVGENEERGGGETSVADESGVIGQANEGGERTEEGEGGETSVAEGGVGGMEASAEGGVGLSGMGLREESPGAVSGDGEGFVNGEGRAGVEKLETAPGVALGDAEVVSGEGAFEIGAGMAGRGNGDTQGGKEGEVGGDVGREDSQAGPAQSGDGDGDGVDESSALGVTGPVSAADAETAPLGAVDGADEGGAPAAEGLPEGGAEAGLETRGEAEVHAGTEADVNEGVEAVADSAEAEGAEAVAGSVEVGAPGMVEGVAGSVDADVGGDPAAAPIVVTAQDGAAEA